MADWTKPCPKCGAEATCEIVDVGPGNVQAGPWCCESCGWIEPDVSLVGFLKSENEDDELPF